MTMDDLDSKDSMSLVMALTAAAAQIEAESARTPEAEPAEQDLEALFVRQKYLSAQLATSRKHVTELQSQLEDERNNQIEIQKQFAAIKQRVLDAFGIEAPRPAPAAAPTPRVAPATPAPTQVAKPQMSPQDAEDALKKIMGVHKFVAVPRSSTQAPQPDASPIR